MENWIRENFVCDVAKDGIEIFRFIRTDAEGTQFPVEAPFAWFVEVFGGVAVPPTATALKGADPEDRMGWHAHFDEWARQGIIQP